MQKAKIILLTTLAAIVYGVVHDQITIRICPEYFTVAHPPLFHTQSLTLLAICWGVAATTGIGVAMGFLLAMASQSGDSTQFPITGVACALQRLMAMMALAAFICGVSGYALSSSSVIQLPSSFAELIPLRMHHRFMAAWFAHGASYAVGLIGGGALIFRIWKDRGSPKVLKLAPQSRWGIMRLVVLIVILVTIFILRGI